MDIENNLNFIRKQNEAIKRNQQLKIGEAWRNKDPYDGEGEIIMTDVFDNYGNILVIHAKNTKYPEMNGGKEWKPVKSILEYYEKII